MSKKVTIYYKKIHIRTTGADKKDQSGPSLVENSMVLTAGRAPEEVLSGLQSSSGSVVEVWGRPFYQPVLQRLYGSVVESRRDVGVKKNQSGAWDLYGLWSRSLSPFLFFVSHSPPGERLSIAARSRSLRPSLFFASHSPPGERLSVAPKNRPFLALYIP